MTTGGPGKPDRSSPLARRARRPLDLDLDLVAARPYSEEAAVPLLVTPSLDGVGLASWLAAKRSHVQEELLRHGAILFRGFGITTPDELQELIATVSGTLLEYTFRSTPRSEVSGRIYSSTEYPADEPIPMHNEMSYTTSWPMTIWFCCVAAPEAGGETPLADSRRVLQRIPQETRQRFAQRRVMYVRNYGGGLDLPWRDVFQTTDQAEVEAFCRAAGIDFEWIGPERLRTKQVCQAVVKHPRTGEDAWFNQAHLFHVSSLRAPVREALLSQLPVEDLPRNAYFGDGSEIEPSDLEAIRAAYEAEKISFPWSPGDVLMLDNVLMAHGREAFAGPRKVIVGMADEYTAQEGSDAVVD